MRNLRLLFRDATSTTLSTLTLCVLALSGVAVSPRIANASSPGAWAQHDKDVTVACRKASGLREPQVQPAVVRFDDTVGLDARLVRGIWPQAHMKGQQALMLCLFDRKTRRAVAQHADDWAGTLPARPN
ncbi:MAG: hypothetical protein ACO29T_04960 [Steroidobacteraceae bacterium]|jgi:hypothetical protein